MSNIQQDKTWIMVGSSILILLLTELFIPTPSFTARLVKLVFVALLSLFIILKSADYCVVALAKYAKSTGISQYIIGFLIVTIGTSLPDLSNTIFASISKSSGLVLGNVLGANVLAMTIVIGITLLCAKRMKVVHTALTETYWTVMGVIILTAVLGLDGKFSRFDAILFLIGLLGFIIRTIQNESLHGKVKKDVKWENIWRPMVIFLGTLMALLLAARWFVFSAITISQVLNIPEFLIGVIVIAFGTTLPEITVGIKSGLRGLHHLGLGNSLGNIIINTGVVLAVGILINPFSFRLLPFFFSLGLLLVAMISLGIFQKKDMTWKHGIFFIGLYVVFIIGQLLLQYY
jgi:cation:H+ antiporter